MKFLNLIIVTTLLCVSCKKDKKSLGSYSGETPSFTNFYFDCDTIPPAPPGGWKDSIKGNDYSVRYWAYNPRIKTQIIYVDYNHKLYSYDFESKRRTFLDDNITHPPQINAYGEVTFKKSQIGIVVLNTYNLNRSEIPGSLNSVYPKWDYSGLYLFFTDHGICIKADKKGNRVDSLNFDPNNTAFSRTSNNYLLDKTGSIYLRNIYENSEKYLFTESLGFLQPCFSKDDSYLFWWDWSSRSLNRFNLRTEKKDILQKSCENYFFTTPYISPNSDKLTVICHRYKLINSPNKIFREDIPLEFNLKTKQWRELHIQF